MEKQDEELLAAIREGNDAAMSALLARHAPSVYRFGMKMCRDPEDAKDVLQETLLAAARGIRELRAAASLSTWLYTVARSFCIKKRRTSKLAPHRIESLDEAAGEPAAQDKSPEEMAAGRELAALLDGAIAELEPAYREVLVLRDVEGLTAPEVAEVLGVSADAVKSRLHRARGHVRARLEARLPHAERPGAAPATGGCPDVVTLFSQYVEGDIGPVECEAMQRHVASCERCNAACESLKHTLAMCNAESRADVPPDVQELVRNALRALAPTSRA
jgi:RNA polymerase sigma-70 factor (ECF subfamily)